jgi:uncharacterized protein YdeI (YjbR/CyaY-like superfamily)
MSERGAADYPVESFASRSEWREWLERHHESERGVWVRFAKKGSGIASVTYAEALDVALCYGWIDGQSKGLDEMTYLQKFTPRGRRSMWSKRNREHVERLIALGEMQPAGLAAIEAAQRDGRWDRAYDSPATAEVPADLAAALRQNAKARSFFETLKGQNRYAILHRIQTSIRPETRARRIAQFVEMLERGETIHRTG